MREARIAARAVHDPARVRATLVYNAKAGAAVTQDEVIAQLERVGWQVDRCVSTGRLDDCLCHGADAVVVAGGDGTVGRVAKRLAGTGVPLAIVPAGTANNLARSLGVGVEPSTAVAALARAIERRIDLGVVSAHLSREYFIEGFGVGVFAHVLGEKAAPEDKALRKALGLLADEAEEYEARHVEIEVDGRDVSGKYVMAAAMNVRSLGPALGLAPDARCDDGELDVVLVPPEAKRALVAHLHRAAEAGDVALPSFETMRAKHVRLRADGLWAHVDDVARQLEGEVHVDVAAGAVKVLAPPHGG
jgi:diacylglycerol kinase family enzyme